MLGIIVTGHGTFASGLTSAMRVISGEPQCYNTVDFIQSDSQQNLYDRLNEAIESMKECEGILVFTDLAAGSPFKTAVQIKKERSEKIEVLAGTNLAMLIEVAMSRTFIDDLNELTKKALEAGKDQIFRHQ